MIMKGKQVRIGMNEPLNTEKEEATCEYLRTPTNITLSGMQFVYMDRILHTLRCSGVIFNQLLTCVIFPSWCRYAACERDQCFFMRR
jgi:hypothetical protein